MSHVPGLAVRGAHRPKHRAVPQTDLHRPASDTAQARLWIAAVSLGSLVLGLVALVLGLDWLRWPSLLFFAGLGVGSAPWQSFRRIGLATRLGLTGLTALVAWTLPATFMVATGWWRPHLVFALFAVICSGLHALAAQAAWSESAGRSGRRVVRMTAPPPESVLGAVGAALCLGAALGHRIARPDFWGFLVEIGPLWYIGLALLLFAFVAALGEDERRIAVVVVLLVVVLTLTPSLVYEGARSQSAFKHIDLVLQIREEGTLLSSVALYESWAGFFAAVAWVSEVTGIRDIEALARFWPPLLAVFRLVALRFLAGCLLPTPSLRWIAVMLAVLADSISADYFSPQSVGFVLGLGTFAVALSAGLGPARGITVALAGVTLAVSHQLSPFIVGGVLVVLVLFRQVRPWWTPLLVIVPAVAWTLVHSETISGFISWDTLGQITNFRPPATPTAPDLGRLPVVPATVIALTGGILVVGFLALWVLVRTRRSLRSWALACSPAVGLALVAVNPYGQEGIFRAALFGIPWLAVLAAPAFAGGRGRRRRVPLLITVAALTCTFLVSSFGLDGINVIRRADAAALSYAQERSGDRFQMLYLGPGDLPTTLRRGPLLLDPALLDLPVEELAALEPEVQRDRLTAAFVEFWPPPDEEPVPMYAIWSPVSAAYGEAYGLQRPESFARLRDAFLDSPYWDVVFEQDGTLLFRLDPREYRSRT